MKIPMSLPWDNPPCRPLAMTVSMLHPSRRPHRLKKLPLLVVGLEAPCAIATETRSHKRALLLLVPRKKRLNDGVKQLWRRRFDDVKTHRRVLIHHLRLLLTVLPPVLRRPLVRLPGDSGSKIWPLECPANKMTTMMIPLRPCHKKKRMKKN